MLIKKVEEAEVISLKYRIQMIKLPSSVLFLMLSTHGLSLQNAMHTALFNVQFRVTMRAGCIFI